MEFCDKILKWRDAAMNNQSKCFFPRFFWIVLKNFEGILKNVVLVLSHCSDAGYFGVIGLLNYCRVSALILVYKAF